MKYGIYKLTRQNLVHYFIASLESNDVKELKPIATAKNKKRCMRNSKKIGASILKTGQGSSWGSARGEEILHRSTWIQVIKLEE